ncbi:hypothetical protein [Oceanobacillus sp. CAU 1775]
MYRSFIYLVFALVMLMGCTDKTVEEPTTEASNANSDIESSEEESASENKSGEEADPEENSTTNNNDKESNENMDTLANYSAEEIEYARVWLQLGPNQELDELYAKHIPANTALNPDDETSEGYPEDVIQLSGTRLVDGSITYSGNGDGTINVYNVPLRWDGVYPAGEEFYIDIIENTEQVPIEPGNDDEVIELIKLLHIEKK